jgi:hypothetical protein
MGCRFAGPLGSGRASGIALDAVPLVIFQPLGQKISLTGSAFLRRRECVGQRPIWSRLPPKKLGFPPRNSLDRARPSVTRASCTKTLTAPVAASADRRCARSGIPPAGPAKDCLCALSTSSFPQKAGWLASVFLGAAPAAFQSRTVNFFGIICLFRTQPFASFYPLSSIFKTSSRPPGFSKETDKTWPNPF